MVYLIVENEDIGGRDSVKRLILGCDSVYGGDVFPAFSSEDDAEEFISKRKDSSYRQFKVISLHCA